MAAVEQWIDPELARVLDETARIAEASGIFARIARPASRLECSARGQPKASYIIESEGGRLSIAWTCPDRYISQSIEADLMWTGDDLNELIDEELADKGYSGKPLGRVEHFRDTHKNFVFRSAIPGDPASADPRSLAACLFAFEAAFAELGDMKPDEE